MSRGVGKYRITGHAEYPRLLPTDRRSRRSHWRRWQYIVNFQVNFCEMIGSSGLSSTVTLEDGFLQLYRAGIASLGIRILSSLYRLCGCPLPFSACLGSARGRGWCAAARPQIWRGRVRRHVLRRFGGKGKVTRNHSSPTRYVWTLLSLK